MQPEHFKELCMVYIEGHCLAKHWLWSLENGKKKEEGFAVIFLNSTREKPYLSKPHIAIKKQASK